MPAAVAPSMRLWQRVGALLLGAMGCVGQVDGAGGGGGPSGPDGAEGGGEADGAGAVEPANPWTLIAGAADYDRASAIAYHGGELAVVGNTGSFGATTDGLFARVDATTGEIDRSVALGADGGDYTSDVIRTDDG